MNGLIKVRANIQEPKVTGWVGVCQIWKSVEEHGHIYFAGMTESEYQNRSWCAMLSDFSITMSCGIERNMSRADAIVEEAIGKPFKREHHNRSVREDDWKTYDYVALDVGVLTAPDQKFRTTRRLHVSLAYFPCSNAEAAGKMKRH